MGYDVIEKQLFVFYNHMQLNHLKKKNISNFLITSYVYKNKYYILHSVSISIKM